MHTNLTKPTPPPPPAPATGRVVGPLWVRTRLGLTVTTGPDDRMRWATGLTAITIVVAGVCAALGRIPFDLPMPMHLIGMVCPTCGLTRGTVAITRGHWALALRYNPGSFLVPVAAAALMVRLVVGLIGANTWVNVRYRPTRLTWITGAVVLVTWWSYQQSNAMFIMHSHVV